VSDQHVHILRDQFPLGPDLDNALQVESPILDPGLRGAAVELDTVDDHFLILETDAVGKQLLAGFSVLLEAEVMVAGNNDFVRVGQGAQEIVELPDVHQCPVTGQIAGVDEYVSVGDFEGSVDSVSVADGDEFHGPFFSLTD